MALLIWLLGVVDVYLTRYGLQLGVITEGNPVMAHLFEIHPDAAVAFSVGLSALLLFCLQHLRSHCTLAGKAMKGLLAVRVVVILLHVNWLLRVRYIL